MSGEQILETCVHKGIKGGGSPSISLSLPPSLVLRRLVYIHVELSPCQFVSELGQELSREDSEEREEGGRRGLVVKMVP